MEKIKWALAFILSLLYISKLKAQDEIIIKPGLIRTEVTITPSYWFSAKQTTFYLHGVIEGYLEKNISLAGEGYMSLGSGSSNYTFDYNHSIFWGINYHFIKNNNDVYVGLQPGLSFAKLNSIENNLTTATAGVNPLISALVGYNFYINKAFHFSIQTRIITGQHNYDARKDLTEIRFSIGLGLNLNTIK